MPVRLRIRKLSRTSMIRTLSVAALALLVLSSFGGVVNATTRNTNNILVTPTAYDWPMLMHDSNHSSAVIEPGPYTNNVLAKSSLKSPIITSPAAANNTIYLISGQTLKALNSSDLSTFWSKSLGENTRSSPASSGGEVYVCQADGTILAINGVTGNTDWRIMTGVSIVSSPTVLGGMLYVSLSNGILEEIDTTTQAVIWTFNSGSTFVASPAVSGNYIAVGAANGIEYFINKGTGTLYWSVTTGGPISSSASFFHGTLAYFGSNDTKVYAVNLVTKSVTWTFKTTGDVLSTPVSDGVNVYAASFGGSLYALSAASGSSVWTFSSGAVDTDLALAEGTYKGFIPTFVPMVYVVSVSGEIYGVNRATGSSVWSLALTGGNGGSPIVAYTKIYVGTATGYFAEIGALRYVTAAATFDTSGNYVTSFSPTSTVILAANAAWGKYGLNNTFVSVSGPGKGHPLVLINATMLFEPGLSNYNLYYSFNLVNAPVGTYKVTVALEDANPKTGSAHPRCCGWVDFKTTFTVT